MLAVSSVLASKIAASSSPSWSSVNDEEPPLCIRMSEKYTCALCNLDFENSKKQREHMKGEWHIYNLQRRMKSLPSVNFVEYSAEIASSGSLRNLRIDNGSFPGTYFGFEGRNVHEQEPISSSGESESEFSDSALPNTNSEFDDVVENPSHVEDSDQSEEDPMPSRSNLDAFLLPSGKIISNKSTQREHIRARRKRLKAQREGKAKNGVGQTENSPSSSSHQNQRLSATAYVDQTASQQTSSQQTSATAVAHTPTLFPILNLTRALSRRDTAGIVGLSQYQQKALLAMEKKTAMLEIRTKSWYQAGVERTENSQKHYRIGGSRGGKKMGGLEKRLG